MDNAHIIDTMRQISTQTCGATNSDEKVDFNENNNKISMKVSYESSNRLKFGSVKNLTLSNDYNCGSK